MDVENLYVVLKPTVFDLVIRYYSTRTKDISPEPVKSRCDMNVHAPCADDGTAQQVMHSLKLDA